MNTLVNYPQSSINFPKSQVRNSSKGTPPEPTTNE